MTKQEVLQQCTVEGFNVKLPDFQLDRNLYLDTAKALNLIGGKWKGGKTMAFVFQEDPTELLKNIANGEQINLKKEYQFFATPDELADELVMYASIAPTHSILEPSAGQGAIIKAIHRCVPKSTVYYYELMDVNNLILDQIPFTSSLGTDFVAAKTGMYAQSRFDRIVANPPFSKNQDIDHVMMMYAHLQPKGRLVSIMSNHWRQVDHKKCIEFRTWLDNRSDAGMASIKTIERGRFKSSGTEVGGCIVVIDKP